MVIEYKTKEQKLIRKGGSMEFKLVDMVQIFREAQQLKQAFVAVKIEMDGFPKPEVIINESVNIESKLDYYIKTYDENLKHKFAPGIRIVDFTYGETFDEIQYEFQCCRPED